MSKQVQDTSANNAAADYDPSKFSQVDPDSNFQSTVTVGAEDRLVVREGGSDLGFQDAMGFGGRELL
jgi:hypothetical protein